MFIEFPAGKLDPGEAEIATAQRELAEEAGYAAAKWTPLGRIHSVVGYSNEAIDFYVAEGLTHVGATLDAGEFLEIVTMSVDELLAALDRGEVTDAKTVAALLLYARRKSDSMIARRLTIRGARRASDTAPGWSRRRPRSACGWVRNRRDGAVEALAQERRARGEPGVSPQTDCRRRASRDRDARRDSDPALDTFGWSSTE